MTRHALGLALRGLVDLAACAALAPVCVCCQRLVTRPTKGPLCANCWMRVDALASGLSRTLDAPSACGGPVFDVRAAGPYEDTLERTILAFKYGGYTSLAAPLAAFMRRSAADLLERADAVVPVPLHIGRRWSRGFNQASELAAHLGPPLWPVLTRPTRTLPQAVLGAADRRTNVAGAFVLRGSVAADARRRVWTALRYPSSLAGRRLVVVDDVCTTGSTLRACLVLLASQGAEVAGLTAALVSSGRPVPPLARRPHDRGGHRR